MLGPLEEHRGEQAEIQYKPDAAGDFTLYATITLKAPNQIGGAVTGQTGNRNEFTVSCKSTEPTTTAPTP